MKETTGGVGGPVPRYPELITAFSSGRDKYSPLTISHRLKKDQQRSLGEYRIDVRRDTDKNTNVYSIMGPEKQQGEDEEPF